MEKTVVTYVFGWPVVYQWVFYGLVAATVAFFFIAQQRAEFLARRAADGAAEVWTASPVVTQFTATERRDEVRAGQGYDDVHRIRLFRGNRPVGEFVVIRLYEDSFWRLGQSDDLYVTERAKAPIQDHFRSARFRSLLSRANEVLCIGLASSKGEDRERAELLSKHRADRLCELLRASGNFAGISLVSVPFGQALGPVPADPLEEQAQRSAVIIGLSNRDDTISREVLYDELLARVRLTRVDLTNYSRVARLRGREE